MSSASNTKTAPAVDEIESTTADISTPVWLILAIGILFYSSTMYLDRYGGEMSANVYVPGMSPLYVKGLQPAGGGGLYDKGEKVYLTYCQPCHGPTGAGGPLAPQLGGSEWVTGEGPNRVIRIVLNAVGGPIEVAGKQFNLDGMIAWRDTISDDEDIAAVITFIRGNKSWGNSASAATKEQVKKIRDETAGRGSMKKWTAPELLAIPDKD